MPKDAFGHPGFTRFWAAETISEFGTYITTLALQVLVVLTLSGTAADVGLLNAARWLPYLLLGLVVGALVDRRRRQPLLVVTDLGRAVLLTSIPLLWLTGGLSLTYLMVVMAGFGLLSLVNDAASQSYLPRLVPRDVLLLANAQLNQSAAVAQTSGPVVAGGLVTALGAPFTVLVDAATYLVSGVLMATIRTTERVTQTPRAPGSLRREIGEGLVWVYRHRTLAPMALVTHGWFLFNSVLFTVYVPFALLDLGLSAFQLGLTLAAAGVGGLLGALAAARLGLRWGAGRTVIAARVLMPLGWVLITLTPSTDPVYVVALLAVGQFGYGLSMGAENANEMGYRQAITPDALQARVNITIRSVNRAMSVIGAPTGGLLADQIGYRPTFWIAIVGLLLVVSALAASPFRHARHDE